VVYSAQFLLSNDPGSDGGPINDETIRSLLAAAGFADWRAAWRSLQRMAQPPQVATTLAACLPYLLSALGSAAGPDAVLVSLERYLTVCADPAAFFQELADNPRAVQVLVTLFSSSQFLTEILLRNPEYFTRLIDSSSLSQVQSSDTFSQAAVSSLRGSASHPDFGGSASHPDFGGSASHPDFGGSASHPVFGGLESIADCLDALRRFQRWELLRIGACDLLGLFDLFTVTRQLSNLADGLIRACLAIANQRVDNDFAAPLEPPNSFTVMALGKLGGRELNYSSDIDLLFLSSSDDLLYRRLGQKLIENLSSVTGEGFLYRVDMRLRPWGRAGALVPSLDAYLAYLKQGARPWEKQALLKARGAAGDPHLAADFLQSASPFIYASTPEAARVEVYSMKQRTESHLRQKGRVWGEVKLGEGSIRDIEFVVQYLQLAYGARQPEIRSRNTLEALQRLTRYRLVSIEESRILTDGYTFLRTIEHHLQIMHYRQIDTLPGDPQALAHLSRRLGFQGENSGDLFVSRYQQHCQAIRQVYLKFMEAPLSQSIDSTAASVPEIRRHIERMHPSYQSAFSAADIARHTLLIELLDADHLVQVDAVPLEDEYWRVTIVAYDYPGELSLICGLMFVYGLDISDGNVFTYENLEGAPTSRKDKTSSRKIVDVFTVLPASGVLPGGIWERYASDLSDLLQLARRGERQEASLHLARRATSSLPALSPSASPLYPIEIEIDNESSPHDTILRISATDTTGFLYELTNALAFNRVYISRVAIETIGAHVHDTLYVTDDRGRKITAPLRQRELRTATVLTKHFTHLLPLSPDPEAAMVHFHEFTGELFRRDNWPDELASLERPEVLGALAQLLGVSEFLWHDFLRMQHANLFPVVRDIDALPSARSQLELQAELDGLLCPERPGPSEADWRSILNAFKDRQMFRIDMRHILGHTQEFGEFAEELTILAEVVVQAAFNLIGGDLRRVYGAPCLEDGEPSPMTVCALGKCGGRELGFASDIELMVIYAGNGHTRGPEVVTTAEFYEKLVETFVGAIRSRREGIFEIDLQLRPYGKAGSLAVSLEAFRRYFAPQGPAWPYERQSLVRLRPIAGDESLGGHVAALRDEFVYTGAPFDVTSLRAMRERQLRHLVKGGTFNPKFSPGGLVDVEYLVQALQITYGAQNPALRTTNTRQAMSALTAASILSADDYTQIHKAHTFLRWLIDSLRMVAGNAKDLLMPPVDSDAFAYLARRLRYGSDRARLQADLLRFTASVQEINRRLLDSLHLP
jgi:glutamate-ammonia-ligase adenylyltransferase